MSVSYTLDQATPYSALLRVISLAGSVSGPTSINLLSAYASAYGAGYASTPLYKLLNNDGAAWPSLTPAINAFYGNCDTPVTLAIADAGFANFSVYVDLSGASVGNFRLSVTDIKDTNAPSALGYIRISLRHSIVR